jgi:LemA protein
MQADGVKETESAENMFENALKSLFAVSEDYPDLKADQNFRQLQEELVDTENKIQAARRFYNGAVRDLNTKIRVFPTNMLAKLFGFQQRDFFEVDDMPRSESRPR